MGLTHGDFQVFSDDTRQPITDFRSDESPIINEKLGLERADAVKRHLYESHQIPLHKINIISFGDNKLIAPNKTCEGRAQSRRVVSRVLS